MNTTKEHDDQYIAENKIREMEEQGEDLRDEADIASHAEMRFNALALQRQREKNKPETHPDFDGVHCIDCEDEIPAGRLALHKIRCKDCQEILQKRRDLFGGR